MYKRPTLIDIKLTDEWMGHPKGSKFSIEENQAKSMIARGVAKIDQHWQPSAKAIEEEKERQALKKTHDQSAEELKVEVSSKIQRRDKDKMIRVSLNKDNG